MKLQKAFFDISSLEAKIKANSKENDELNRLNKENEILKVANENMQGQIKKFEKEITDLKANLQKVENEKQEEKAKTEKIKISYDAKINDLKSQNFL